MDDVVSDRKHVVAVEVDTAMYESFSCIDATGGLCAAVREIPPGDGYKVLRIRYGKDYMAIKVQADLTSGWILNEQGVALRARTGT
ncbi:hypothetical protein GCM10023333_41640 [Ferrimonas pelagia]|uniref:Uncharacterized protein n=1 Tax=Ferrimonas pelagia TaxID=1177826 RepID=A0ABP9FHF6_9GAMM